MVQEQGFSRNYSRTTASDAVNMKMNLLIIMHVIKSMSSR